MGGNWRESMFGRGARSPIGARSGTRAAASPGRWSGWLLALVAAALLGLAPGAASAQWGRSEPGSGGSGPASGQGTGLTVTRDPVTGRVVIQGRLPGVPEGPGMTPDTLAPQQPAPATESKPRPSTDEPASP